MNRPEVLSAFRAYCAHRPYRSRGRWRGSGLIATGNGQGTGVDLDAFLAVAVDLLGVQSTADRPELLRRAVDTVIDFVGPGFRVERFDSNGKPSALVYPHRFHGARRPEFRVVFNAHLDVVPGEPEQFRPRREGDRLYARGAQDMKVSALVMAQVFRETAARLPYPLALQLVADEEVGARTARCTRFSRA